MKTKNTTSQARGTSTNQKPIITPAFVAPPWRTEVYWQCYQVSYGIHPSKVRVGLRVGFCEHAMSQFTAGNVPKVSRFFLGTVVKIAGSDNDLMTIDFDGPKNRSPQSITCGIKAYAQYLVPAGPTPTTGVTKEGPSASPEAAKETP